MDVTSLEIPELTTFGALIRHALALEGLAAAVYRELGESKAEMASRHEARQTLLERTRREKLSEMILEPIDGLAGEKYVPAATPAGAGVQLALEVEAVSALFYRDSSKAARMVLAEVSKVFERLALENDKLRDEVSGSAR